MDELRNIPDWSYLLDDKKKIIFQAFGKELLEGKKIVSTPEYCFDMKSKLGVKHKNINGIDFYRIGIKYNSNDLLNMGLEENVFYSNILNKNVPFIDYDSASRIITPESGFFDILNNKVRVNQNVYKDLVYVVELLMNKFGSDLINNIGVEGSLLFGISNDNSDIDFLINGSEAYRVLLREWPKIVVENKILQSLTSSNISKMDMYNHRREYIPYSKKEILFHESRKLFTYIISNDIIRKINFVCKFDEQEMKYVERFKKYFEGFKFKPIDLCYASGKVISNDNCFAIPSIYDVKISDLRVNDMVVNNKSVTYVIDYIGSYFMHLCNNEEFECVGILEQLYDGENSLDQFRISLNPWDKTKRKVYLKRK